VYVELLFSQEEKKTWLLCTIFKALRETFGPHNEEMREEAVKNSEIRAP
jgi:hypothetical protein